jgi:hypothetical protein
MNVVFSLFHIFFHIRDYCLVRVLNILICLYCALCNSQVLENIVLHFHLLDQHEFPRNFDTTIVTFIDFIWNTVSVHKAIPVSLFANAVVRIVMCESR